MNEGASPLGEGPRVSVPQRPWAVWAGVAGVAALGIVTFATLNAARQRQADPGALAPPQEAAPGREVGAGLPEPPAAPVLFAPPPAEPPPPLPAQEPAPVVRQTAVEPVAPPVFLPPPPPAPSEEPPRPGAAAELRMKSPALVVDLTNPPAAAAPPGGDGGAPAAADAIAQRLTASEPQPVRASQIGDPATLIPQGVMIGAVLETAINSDLPGFVRAVVSREVRGFDGTRVLIPRGSRLVGQYRSEIAVGQRRAFVVWTRLIRPDGVTIQLGSPGADPLGRAGLEGRVDRHLLERFGPGLLTTALNAAVANNTRGNSTQLIIGTGNQAIPAALGPVDGQGVKPTVRIAQGAAIQVFVARDLDFSSVASAPEPAP